MKKKAAKAKTKSRTKTKNSSRRSVAPKKRAVRPAKTKGKSVAKRPAAKKSAAKKPVIKKAAAKEAAVKQAAVSKTAREKNVVMKAAVPAAAPAAAAAAPTAVAPPLPKPPLVSAVPVAPAGGVPAKKVYARPSPQVLAKVKPLSRRFLFELCEAIKEAVEPVARAVKGREVVSTATSGDATFEIDRLAEKALLMFLRRAKAPVAYYSEDSGYSTFSNAQPKNLLIVDPIDGTRAAKSGFEGCTISVASTRVIERPLMSDVDNACVMEIIGNRTFYAERASGARIYEQGHVRKPKLSTNTDLESLCWSMTVPARPAELIFPTAARLIDLSSLKGGFFSCNSTSFSLTRLITNQLDACIDFAIRFMRDIPEAVRDYFINAGRGTVLSICPYDMVAAVLIAEEAGCAVSDAFGRGFNDVLLLDSSEHNHQSLIAAGNKELHEKLLLFFERRISQFEQLLLRRHARKSGQA